jgi:PAS domain-containing protein
MDRHLEFQKTFDRYIAILLGFVIFINVLAVTGWIVKQPILASLRADYIPMAPATGLLFLVFCGVWLIQKRYFHRQNVRMLIRLILVGMFLVVVLLAIRYFTGLGPDIEQLLSPNPPLFGQILSARMSPLTALGFLLAIPAFLLLTINKPGNRTKSASAILSLIVFFLNGIYYLGYIFRAPLFYGGRFIPISLTSVLAFLFLSLALMLSAGSTIWQVRMYIGSSINARLMRVFIPVSFVIVLFQGLLSEVFNPWNINPAYRVAVAALMACIISMLIISFMSHNIGAEIDRGDRARLEAEKTLAQSEERFRKLFEHAAIGVALIDTSILILTKDIVISWDIQKKRC